MVFNKAPIEVSKPKKASYTFNIFQYFLIFNSSNFLQVYLQSFTSYNNKFQVLSTLNIKFILINIQQQSSSVYSFKNLISIYLILFQSSISIDKHVIQVGRAEVVHKLPQGLINIALKSTQSICYTKGGNQLFIQPKSSAERSLLFISSVNLDLIERCRDINLYKLLSFRQII